MDNLLGLPNGTVLADDYRIEQVLGAGGFGITYLAEELALQRKVAIKEYFPGEFAARDGASQVRHRSESNKNDYAWGLERFIEEAQTLARFDHANIVRVYRYFRANNTAYMVLKFEEGQSVRQWVDSLKIAPTQEKLDRILVPILDALELIHANDFLHRDIAADNILLRRNGSPVLIDFGSARGEIASHTKTLSALVKPGYSPFEQYASNGKQQGPWTDIYALAATLYLLVTGRRPQDAPSRITEDEYVQATVAAKGRYRESFLRAIDTALELQIDKRPKSIVAWRNILFAQAKSIGETTAPGASVVVPMKATRKIDAGEARNLAWKKKAPEPQPELKNPADATPPQRPVRQRAMSGVAHIGRKAGAISDQMRAGGKAGAAAAHDVVAKAGSRGKALAARAVDARPVMPHIPKFKAPKITLPTVPKLRRPSLAPLRDFGARFKRPATDVGKTQAPRSLVRDLEQELAKPLPAPEAQPEKPATPSWARKLFRGKQPTHAAKPSKTAARRKTKRPRRSPARRLLWLSGMVVRAAAIVGFVSFLVIKPRPDVEPTVAAWSTANSPATTNELGLIRTFRGHGAPITTLAVSDDGRRIASTSQDGAGMIWKSTNGRQVANLDAGNVIVNAMDIAGNQLVMAQADGRVTMWNLRSGKRSRVFKGHAGAANVAVFATSPKKFFSAGADERLRLWNAQRGSWRSMRGHKGAVIALAASKDDRTLVSGGEDRTVKLWDARRNAVLKTWYAHDKAISAVAVAPDGQTFASGSVDESIRIYPDRGNGEIMTIYGHTGPVTALAFSPSGQLLASASADHAVKLWNVKTGKLIHTFIGHTGAVTALEFMPDGRRLVTASADKTARIWNAQVAGFR